MSRTLAGVCFVCLLLIPPSLLAQKPLPASFTFALQVQGVGTGTSFFKSVGGLSSQTEVTEFREGGDNGVTRKIAGATHFPNLTLKRPVTSDPSLAIWRKIVEDGQFQQARRNAVIILYDKTNKEVARWLLVNAWPSGIAIETDPDTGDALEVLTLAVDASQRQ